VGLEMHMKAEVEQPRDAHGGLDRADMEIHLEAKIE